MKVAIIGAGWTGLTTAAQLIEAGDSVEIFDLGSNAGGLSSGFKESAWTWFLDDHYHHLFTSDQTALDFLARFQLAAEISFQPAITKTLFKQGRYPLDSALSLLSLPNLSISGKLRTGATLAALKVIPRGEFLEKWPAQQLLKKMMGEEAWQLLWQPLFTGKFGDLAGEINAAWFWARIFTRSAKLGYPRGGFQQLTNQLVAKLSQRGVKFHWRANFLQSKKNGSGLKIQISQSQQKKWLDFDQVLFTGSSSALAKVSPWPTEFQQQLTNLDFLAAQTLILVLKKQFLTDGTYWLNINRPNWPFLAVVEQTNLVAPEHYANQHLVYVGRYLSVSDPARQLTASQLLASYQPFLTKLQPQLNNILIKVLVKNADFAQPITRVNHRQLVPAMTTPQPNFFWASMQHIYPYDRGVNFAIKLGLQAAQTLLTNRGKIQ